MTVSVIAKHMKIREANSDADLIPYLQQTEICQH